MKVTFKNVLRLLITKKFTSQFFKMKKYLPTFIWSFLISSFLSAQPAQQNSAAVPADFKNLPVVSWKFKTSQPFISSPVLDSGVVYVGCLDSSLYAIDLNTGNLKWKFKTNGPLRSTVCIDNNQLFLVSGDGNFYCLDKNSGKSNWVFKTKGEKQYDIFDYFQSTPVIANGIVYFGSGDGNVYALNANDGKLKWNYETGGAVHTKPAISSNKLFVGSFDGNLYALNTETGRLIWKFKSVGHDYFPKGEMQFSPSVANGLVYIGGRDYNLYALDAEKGYCHWNQEFPAGWVTTISPSLKNDSIIYVGTSDPLVLLAMNGISGETLWKAKLFNIFTPCIFSATMSYASTTIGKLYGVDLKSGQIQWTFNTEGYEKNHQLYFKPDGSFRDDILSILKTNDDFINAIYKVGGMFSGPAISQDYIVISAGDGIVYCLKRV